MAISRVGSNAKSFSIIQPDSGTTPVAQSPNETLTLTSSDGSIVIEGDFATDTLDFTLSPSAGGGAASNINIPGSAALVASGSTTNIINYTVPPGDGLNLELIEFNGENIARFQILINDVLQATKHTWFGGQLFGEFYFDNLLLSPGDNVKLQVLHQRPDAADFYGRILGTLL